MTEEDYVAFLATRSEEERWQLIDGNPFMMTSPTGTHQRIASNLGRLLDSSLETNRPTLATLPEIGVRIPGHPKFLPIPDLVVADALAPPSSYLDKFYLAAEVLSESNTPEFIELKVSRYGLHPDNLYTLVIHQIEIRCEVWSRASGWTRTVLEGPDALLDLPEFGYRKSLRPLYRNTMVAPVDV
jgi:Uma2 family endonuclease